MPTVIHEQNAVIGRANGFLAPRVTAIATSHAEVRGTEKVRAQDRADRQSGAPGGAGGGGRRPIRRSSADGPFRLLVFGGSQGARFMSDLVPPAVALLCRRRAARLAIVQQCRPEDMARVEAAYDGLGVAADLAALLPRHAAAHRRTATSSSAAPAPRPCAELAVIGRPAIMVPLPGALDQDQKANAMVLAAAGGGWMVEQKDMTPERLAADLAQPDGRSGAPVRRRRGGAQSRPPGCGRAPRRCGRACRGRRSAGRCRSCRMKMGLDIGPVHFVGIGGIGMSGIAEVLVNLGYRVQGSDAVRQRQCPAPAREGHRRRHRP